MNFEVKKAYTVGGVKSNGDTTMTQFVNIQVGVVGCPHEDIKTEVTAHYIFSEDLSAKQIEDGIAPFAAAWVVTNYPNT